MEILNLKELKQAVFIASLAGGDVRCVAPGGEVKWEIGLKCGITRGANLVQYCDDGDQIQLVGGIFGLLPTGNRVRGVPAAAVVESGANPDFAPTTFTEAEQRMRKLMVDVQRSSKALEKRQASFEAAMAKHVTPVREPDPDPVVEPDPEPAPEPEPAREPEPAPEPETPAK
jgi:hypothetical protein